MTQRKARGPTKKIKEIKIITRVAEDGTPVSPKSVATTFTNFCGSVVRDNVPINIQRWRKQGPNDQSFVPDRQKEMLWTEVKEQFRLPEGTDEQKVKAFALKKMAEQLRSYRKRMHNEFVKKGTTPDFEKFPKLRDG